MANLNPAMCSPIRKSVSIFRLSDSALSPLLCGEALQPRTDIGAVADDRFCLSLYGRYLSSFQTEFSFSIIYIVHMYVLFVVRVIVLRVCPKTSGGITKFSEHEAD